ncbi:alpha/beta hydrolase [Lasiosphaeria ovina]|uniref:Alpha/beta hydrolase n=1 Tax=Lasiosphaeria ovina TaxID=92902 RepID=A0AAE0JXJ8_9PEZI|nr:alpha/beta hydrolase [Lasiosphaeria ovina]
MPFISLRNFGFIGRYLDDGPADAQAVLLVHGMTCDLHDWNSQVPFLLGLGYRVIAADLRGHGHSLAPTTTPGTCAEDLAALLEDHPRVPAPVVVVSHSLGDLAGYYLAVTRPDLVRASVGVDPMHGADNAARNATADFFDVPPPIVPKMAGYFEVTYPADTPPWQKAWHLRRLRQLDEAVACAVAWGRWGDPHSLGRRENALAAFRGKRQCPRLTIGSSEAAVDLDSCDLVRDEMDEFAVIEGNGHWFHQIEVDKFNATLKAWLGKIGALPASKA